ncbi:MAG: hypothetical protein QOK51_03880 [Nitrososphaeraceae archaeon]|nr:hypothetical protein [Nitrososphaeraceae archaeon]MDW0227015.1 hypothetical protein [Nitrososphaeraceae archaeon]MDW0329566.1 hypothetical protein [Nitrososphaeraceae archaeon]MDW3621247.1 hypothetical protein [Nitrososphaeraceae archaeon]
MSDSLFLFLEKSTIFLLVISLGLFSWSALSSRNLRKFQFQMSIFVLIWIAGEIVRVLHEEGIFMILGRGDVGMILHTIAMLFFSLMLWIRFYYAKKSGKMMIEST